MTTGTTMTEAPETTKPPAAGPVDVHVLAAGLAAATASLDAHIAAAADRIAGPRIAAAEAACARQLDQERSEHQVTANRAEGVIGELRRHLDAQLAQVARLRWAARYLPGEIRLLVLSDPPRTGAWAGDRPDPQFIADLDGCAAAAGLTAYPRAGTPRKP